jgi:hypothetical protein
VLSELESQQVIDGRNRSLATAVRNQGFGRTMIYEEISIMFRKWLFAVIAMAAGCFGIGCGGSSTDTGAMKAGQEKKEKDKPNKTAPRD